MQTRPARQMRERSLSGGVLLLWLAGLLLGAAAGGATTYMLVNASFVADDQDR